MAANGNMRHTVTNAINLGKRERLLRAKNGHSLYDRSRPIKTLSSPTGSRLPSDRNGYS